MTPKMRAALALVREHGESYSSETDKWGIVTSGPTHLSSGQPWINWRTADALARAGLARLEGYGEEAEIIVPAEEPAT